MAKIVLNPRIPNNIRIVEYADYINCGIEKHRELATLYEQGYLIIIRGYKFRANLDFFSAINFPNTKASKKIFLSTHENNHNDSSREKEWNMVNTELLKKNEHLIKDFYNNVVSANSEVFRLIENFFPLYNYTKKLCVYNLTEMLCHNLHFDSPRHSNEKSQVRMFANIDNFPRIWHLSESLESVSSRNYEACRLDKTIGKHPREFTQRITTGTYGDRYASNSQLNEKHSIAFQPGEIWFLNPNMTAHEIVYGRRLLDGIFMFDKEDLLDKSRYYPTLVNKIHQEKLGAFGFWRTHLKNKLIAKMRSTNTN